VLRAGSGSAASATLPLYGEDVTTGTQGKVPVAALQLLEGLGIARVHVVRVDLAGVDLGDVAVDVERDGRAGTATACPRLLVALPQRQVSQRRETQGSRYSGADLGLCGKATPRGLNFGPTTARRSTQAPSSNSGTAAPQTPLSAQDFTIGKVHPPYDVCLVRTGPTTMPTAEPTAKSLALKLTAALALLAIAGCGAEVAGGAAAVGGLQTTAATQARAQQSKVVDGMKAVQDAGMARAASAAD
jgi:hypothetical protein